MSRTVATSPTEGVGRADDSRLILEDEGESARRSPEIVGAADDTESRTTDDAGRQQQVTRDEGDTMIRSGDTLHNPVTGELVRFVEAAADTGGEYVLIEVVVEPDGAVAAAHVHPYQTETFEILEGEITFRSGSETIVAKAGDIVRVDPGTKHKFWNAGETDARFRTEVRPALQFESLIETMFALAADGKTNRKGMPNPLRLAVIANHHFDDVRLPFPPAWVQKVGLALGAPLGRLLGYSPTYEPAAPSDAALAL
jgi:quercetin dioxygenase-like cupin family protein